MGLNFDPTNLNPEQIFNKLDAADGKVDNKIKKSIWDGFAGKAGGKTINHFIEKDNAIRSIECYLKRATDSVKGIISTHLNSLDTEATGSTTATAATPATTSSAQGNTPMKRAHEIKEKERKKYEGISDKEKAELLGKMLYSEEFMQKVNGDYDYLNDEYSKTFFEGYKISNKDINWGERLSIKQEVSTTEEERKEVLNYVADNGYTYIKAMRKLDEIKKMAWKAAKPYGGWTSEKIEEFWNKHKDELLTKAGLYGDYYKVLADIEEIESKYPNAKNCLHDLFALHSCGASNDGVKSYLKAQQE